MNDLRQTFSDRLWQVRLTRDKSVGQIARAIGMKQDTVYNYFYRQYPKLETLCKMADYLNVSVDYLLGRTDEMEVQK